MSSTSNTNATLRAIADGLLIAGGLNWGSIALTNGRVNPVDNITGGNNTARNLIYGAVGVAALYVLADDIAHGPPRSGFFRQVRKA